METTFEQQQLASSIQNEYLTISSSFTKLSQYFLELSKEQVDLNQLHITLPTLTQQEALLTHSSSNNPKEEENKEIEKLNGATGLLSKPKKRRRRRGNRTTFSVRPIRRRKRTQIQYNTRSKTFCKIYAAQIAEGELKTVGYKIHIKYRNIADIIGPYKEYSFVNLIKNHLQQQLESFDPSYEKNECIARRCLKELKEQIYAKYPPSCLAKTLVTHQ